MAYTAQVTYIRFLKQPASSLHPHTGGQTQVFAKQVFCHRAKSPVAAVQFLKAEHWTKAPPEVRGGGGGVERKENKVSVW